MPKVLTVHLSEEGWDPVKEQFIPPIEGSIVIEHSLYAIGKWEEKYSRSFFTEGGPSTNEEIVDYIKFMTISTVQDQRIYDCIGSKIIQEVLKYMNENHSGSRITKKDKPKSKQPIKERFLSSELIYSWLVGLEIPFEVQYWNFQRMMNLIEICNDNNTPADKMSKKMTAKSYKEINDARLRKHATRG